MMEAFEPPTRVHRRVRIEWDDTPTIYQPPAPVRARPAARRSRRSRRIAGRARVCWPRPRRRWPWGWIATVAASVVLTAIAVIAAPRIVCAVSGPPRTLARKPVGGAASAASPLEIGGAIASRPAPVHREPVVAPAPITDDPLEPPPARATEPSARRRSPRAARAPADEDATERPLIDEADF